MIDARIVPKELQDRIAGQVRKSQDQFRKGQETVNSAFRAWVDAARSMRPQLPELPESLPVKLPGRDAFMTNAHDLAEQIRVAQRKVADQVRQAAEPWAKQMHQVRKATAPLTEQARKAAEPWTKQMHQVRKATAPLTDQVRKAAAPLTGAVTTPAAAIKQPGKASAKPAGAPAAKSGTATRASKVADNGGAGRAGTARKARTAKK